MLGAQRPGVRTEHPKSSGSMAVTFQLREAERRERGETGESLGISGRQQDRPGAPPPGEQAEFTPGVTGSHRPL